MWRESSALCRPIYNISAQNVVGCIHYSLFLLSVILQFHLWVSISLMSRIKWFIFINNYQHVDSSINKIHH